MKLYFHGGVSEVGRSCIEVQTKNSRILLDAGLQITENGNEYPLIRNASHIDAVGLSHAHLDHCGALPYLNNHGLSCHIFCTKMTKVLSSVLLKDSFHVELLEQIHPAYQKENLLAALDLMKPVHYREPIDVRGTKLMFFDAGHIPGSSSILVECGEGKQLLYSGDIATEETQLMPAADIDYGPVDVLICEGTYGNRNHPDRSEEEKRFIKDIKHTLSQGGSVLISVFAVGRAQEIMLILNREHFGVPIYLDGMAKKALAKVLEEPECIKNPEMLKHASHKIRPVKGNKQRQQIMHTPAIIISPSGRLEGGPVIEYLKDFWQHEDCTVMLTGYQAEGTNGRLLIEEGEFYLDGNKLMARCDVKKYDFSSHTGMSALHKYIKKVQPKLLILNHGDPKALEALAQWARKEGIDAKVPKVGDMLVI